MQVKISKSRTNNLIMRNDLIMRNRYNIYIIDIEDIFTLYKMISLAKHYMFRSSLGTGPSDS